MPDCTNAIVDPSGTLLGKIAHIHAAERNGPRFDLSLSPEGRREFDNLFIVCGKHHNIIDDTANAKDYPADLLKKYKFAHERRFRTAERQLIKQFADTTQVSKPCYPKNLRALANACKYDDIADNPEAIEGLRKFIDRLREVPLDTRGFALKLAGRMRRQNADELPANDVMGAFQIGSILLKRQMDILEHHRLGRVDDKWSDNNYIVELFDRDPDGNPWIEILDFCDETGNLEDELLYDLNFVLYDEAEGQ